MTVACEVAGGSGHEARREVVANRLARASKPDGVAWRSEVLRGKVGIVEIPFNGLVAGVTGGGNKVTLGIVAGNGRFGERIAVEVEGIQDVGQACKAAIVWRTSVSDAVDTGRADA